ncbi:hypothetical protein J2Y67_002075 [Neobacillus niacini]|nr:hypothetical protein [Neobacillus niacini]
MLLGGFAGKIEGYTTSESRLSFLMMIVKGDLLFN